MSTPAQRNSSSALRVVETVTTTDSVMSEKLDPPECLARRRELRQIVQSEREQRRDHFKQFGVPSVPEFYAGRNVFVTGASGFIGRVVVEKLLRDCPEIGNIYILLRPRRGLDCHERLKAVLDVPMFDRLRREQPAAMQKVVPVQGDCMELGLGIGARDRQVLTDTVSVVIHAAASVRFTDSVKKAVLLNTRGARELVALAKDMKNLKVLVHLSTAYCFTNHNPLEERVYPTDHDWRDVIKAAELPDGEVLDKLGDKYLGFQPNTYVFSKALSERVIQDASKQLPVIILRPSIVTGALKEPLPGWTDNLNGFGGFWAIASKGVYRVGYCPKPHLKLDLIPVDVVANITILASWLKGTNEGGEDFLVMNAAVSGVKSCSYHIMNRVLNRLMKEKRVVFPGVVRYPMYWNVTNKYLSAILEFFYHILFGTILDRILVLLKRKPMLMPLYRRVAVAMQALIYFGSTDFQFVTSNLWRMQGMMHPDDVSKFNVDEADADWVELSEAQLKGVMWYALKEKNVDVAKDWAHVNRLWWAELGFHVLLAGLGLWLLLLWWG